MPYLMFLLICAIWGASFILMKKASLAFTPAGVGAWRVASGAMVLGVIWWLEGQRWPLRKGDVWPLVCVVLVGYAGPYTIQPYLVARHGSAFIGMIVSFVPLLTMLVSVPLLGVHPTRRQLAGVIGGLACLAAMLVEGLDRQVPWAQLGLAGTVPLAYALTNVWIRRHLSQVPSLGLSFVSLALASAVLAPFAFWLPGRPAPAHEDLLLAVASLALLGIVGTGLATFMFNKLIQDQGPLFAGMVTYLVPVGALVWGWLDQERVTALQLAALAGVLIMVAMVQYPAATPTTAS